MIQHSRHCNTVCTPGIFKNFFCGLYNYEHVHYSYSSRMSKSDKNEKILLLYTVVGQYVWPILELGVVKHQFPYTLHVAPFDFTASSVQKS